MYLFSYTKIQNPKSPCRILLRITTHVELVLHWYCILENPRNGPESESNISDVNTSTFLIKIVEFYC